MISNAFRMTSGKKYALGMLLLFLLALPRLTNDDYLMHVINVAGIYCLMALSLNLLMGYAGQLSLGHAAFYGIGAYTSALLTMNAGLPFLGAMIAAGLLTALIGLLVCLPSLRLRSHYLFLFTAAFNEIFINLARNFSDLTGGATGLANVPKAAIAGYLFRSDYSFYYLILALIVIATLTTARVVNSRIGRAFVAIRDSQNAAEASGINPTYYKSLAFGLSAFWAGIAGSLFAHLVGFLVPENFVLLLSIEFILMIAIGGMASIPGSFLGAILMTVLPEGLRVVSDWRMLIYGVLIIVLVIFLPSGVWGLLGKARLRIAGRGTSGGVSALVQAEGG